MRKSLLIALMALSTLTTFAADPAPRPKPLRGGDYWLRNENAWMEWEAASDLTGRLTPQWPADFQEPGALLEIDWRIERWPVVHKFAKGEHLQALPDAGGMVIMKDIDGSSWLRVKLENGQICFVRANSKFLKPSAQATAKRFVPTFTEKTPIGESSPESAPELTEAPPALGPAPMNGP